MEWSNLVHAHASPHIAPAGLAATPNNLDEGGGASPCRELTEKPPEA